MDGRTLLLGSTITHVMTVTRSVPRCEARQRLTASENATSTCAVRRKKQEPTKSQCCYTHNPQARRRPSTTFPPCMYHTGTYSDLIIPTAYRTNQRIHALRHTRGNHPSQQSKKRGIKSIPIDPRARLVAQSSHTQKPLRKCALQKPICTYPEQKTS